MLVRCPCLNKYIHSVRFPADGNSRGQFIIGAMVRKCLPAIIQVGAVPFDSSNSAGESDLGGPCLAGLFPLVISSNLGVRVGSFSLYPMTQPTHIQFLTHPFYRDRGNCFSIQRISVRVKHEFGSPEEFGEELGMGRTRFPSSPATPRKSAIWA